MNLMNPWLQVILLSILPIVELRGSIPLAFYHGLHPLAALSAAVLSNIMAIPLTFFFLDFVHNYLMKLKFYKKTFDMFMERTRQKSQRAIEKYGYLGLAIFVAIPLPATGAYTGALAAWFFNMKRWHAFWAISLGVLIAGIIVTMIMVSGAQAWRIFIKT